MKNETRCSEMEHPIMRLIMMPASANADGDIFGGYIVSQIDIAGAIVAAKRAGGRIVTVSIESVHFVKPVFIGDGVSFFACITNVGKTSITVDVEVIAERRTGEEAQVTQATIVYVAVDEQRKPHLVDRDVIIA